MAPTRKAYERDRADPQSCSGYGLGKLNITWKLPYFSKRIDRRITSRNFPVEDTSKFGWYLTVHPSLIKSDEENCEYVGCVLHSVKRARGTVFFMRVTLSLCTSKGQELCSPQLFACSLTEGKGIGNKMFMKRSELLDKLRNDELVVHADLNYSLNVVQYTSMSDVQHCLPESTPAMSLVSGISSVFLDQRHSDVVVCVEGKEIPAHKVILSARSNVFSAMLGYQTLENQTNRIEITDFSYYTIYEMIKFMYQGDLKLEPSTVADLLKVADKYDVSDMKAYISNHLMKTVNSENAVQLAVLADKYMCPMLCSQIAKFIAENKSFNLEKNKMDLVKCPLVLYEALSLLLRSEETLALPGTSDEPARDLHQSANLHDRFQAALPRGYVRMVRLPQQHSSFSSCC